MALEPVCDNWKYHKKRTLAKFSHSHDMKVRRTGENSDNEKSICKCMAVGGMLKREALRRTVIKDRKLWRPIVSEILSAHGQ